MSNTADFLEFRKKAILQDDRLFDTKEIANFLNLPIKEIYSLVRTNKIPSYKRGRKIYFFESQIIIWKDLCKKNTNKESFKLTNGINTKNATS